MGWIIAIGAFILKGGENQSSHCYSSEAVRQNLWPGNCSDAEVCCLISFNSLDQTGDLSGQLRITFGFTASEEHAVYFFPPFSQLKKPISLKAFFHFSLCSFVFFLFDQLGFSWKELTQDDGTLTVNVRSPVSINTHCRRLWIGRVWMQTDICRRFYELWRNVNGI